MKDPFQSPRSGKFESNKNRTYWARLCWLYRNRIGFQSPRSGKFESNSLKNTLRLTMSF